MGTVPTEQLTSGMVLAADVRSRNGRLLLKGGGELTDGQLLILRTWGIQEVEVVGSGVEAKTPAPSPCAEVDPTALAAARAALLPLFRRTDLEHPAMAELLRLAALRKVLHA